MHALKTKEPGICGSPAKDQRSSPLHSSTWSQVYVEFGGRWVCWFFSINLHSGRVQTECRVHSLHRKTINLRVSRRSIACDTGDGVYGIPVHIVMVSLFRINVYHSCSFIDFVEQCCSEGDGLHSLNEVLSVFGILFTFSCWRFIF